MFDNVKLIFGKTIDTLKKKLNGMKKPIKMVIVGYFMLVVLLVVTYYSAWLFMTFIAGCFIDMDNNGIPDKFEEDKTHEKGKLR